MGLGSVKSEWDIIPSVIRRLKSYVKIQLRVFSCSNSPILNRTVYKGGLWEGSILASLFIMKSKNCCDLKYKTIFYYNLK